MGAYELNIEAIRLTVPKRDTAKREFTDEELMQLRELFPIMFNRDVAKLLGISETTLHRQARRMGLKKVPNFHKLHRKEISEKISAALEGVPNVGHFKRGERANPAGEFKRGHKEDPETKRRRLEKAHAKRNATIAAERRRILFGLPQKTKLRLKV